MALKRHKNGGKTGISGRFRTSPKPFPFVDTLYARELRAESTAVSLFLI